MAAGYPAHDAQSGEELAHVARLRNILKDAEAELRRRRQSRLDLETNFLSLDAAATPIELPLEPPEDLAMKALASHHDAPPAALHRLAIAVMLLLEAPLLVEMGEHAFPWRVPWRNLQILLRKPCKEASNGASATHASMTSITAALRQKPFGERLAKHVHKILTEDSVTRQEVVDTDRQCASLFDWVQGLITPLLLQPESVQRNVKDSSNAADAQDLRERAVDAVAEQEKEVANLRRKLRDAIRSEQAAQAFVVQHVPRAEDVLQTPGLHKLSGSSQLEDAGLNVTGQKALQYRLEEVAVPEMQEAILHSLVKTLMEPRAGSARQLEIVGHGEDRESDDVAQQRAEAVENWLLDHGVPVDRLSVRWETGGPAICRRTDLRVLEPSGADVKVKERAGEMLKRIFGAQLDLHSETGVASLEKEDEHEDAPADTTASMEKQPSKLQEARPAVHMEEIPGAAGQPRQLRLVFQKETLKSSDAMLEIGARVVRLGSLSGEWLNLEVALPFDVLSPEHPAAKFSKKAGTLTVLLTAAA